mmetsp:Transcript_8856/g.19347  ORF Transcript_8856/g.19347 Transcript_8856/m.19347 type:complete len:203 (-) Transcript_8856:66-674(-)
MTPVWLGTEGSHSGVCLLTRRRPFRRGLPLIGWSKVTRARRPRRRRRRLGSSLFNGTRATPWRWTIITVRKIAPTRPIAAAGGGITPAEDLGARALRRGKHCDGISQSSASAKGGVGAEGAMVTAPIKCSLPTTCAPAAISCRTAARRGAGAGWTARGSSILRRSGSTAGKARATVEQAGCGWGPTRPRSRLSACGPRPGTG